MEAAWRVDASWIQMGVGAGRHGGAVFCKAASVCGFDTEF